MTDSITIPEGIETMDTAGLTVFSGYYIDSEKVKLSSSGGAATALSEAFIKSGGSVMGVRYADDFKSAVYDIAEEISDLEKFRTSKYISTLKKIFYNGKWISVFEFTANLLAEGRRILFIGLGCDVGALLNYVKKNEIQTENLYTIDLICHGPTYPEVQKDYIENLEKRFKSKVITFSVRYKKNGWVPPYIHAEFENGKIFNERFYESDFGYAFKAYSRSSCYYCKFKGNEHVSDLTIGDFWGCKPGMKAYNPQGVSIIFERSDKGRELIRSIEEAKFLLQPADLQLALAYNRSFYSCREQNKLQHNIFGRDLNENGLHYAVRHSSGYKSYRNRKIKRMIKDTIPEPLLSILKKLRSK